jgi:hypothetical protein
MGKELEIATGAETETRMPVDSLRKDPDNLLVMLTSPNFETDQR